MECDIKREDSSEGVLYVGEQTPGTTAQNLEDASILHTPVQSAISEAPHAFSKPLCVSVRGQKALYCQSSAAQLTLSCCCFS